MRRWGLLGMTLLIAAFAGQIGHAADRQADRAEKAELMYLSVDRFRHRPPRVQVAYFFGIVDALRLAGKARIPDPLAACWNPLYRDWMKVAIMFDRYLSNPNFFGDTLTRAQLSERPVPELVERFLAIYCPQFRD